MSKFTPQEIKDFQTAYNIKPINTSKETAVFIGCRPNTLDVSRMDGTLFGMPAPKHIKFGYRVAYRAEDLMSWFYSLESKERV